MIILLDLIKPDGEEIPLWVAFWASSGTPGDSEDPRQIEITGASREFNEPFVNDFELSEEDSEQLKEKISVELTNSINDKYEYNSDEI